MKLSITTDDLKPLIRDLELVPRGLNKAGARAINKSLTATRAEMVRQIRGDYNIKAKVVRDALSIRRASWSYMTGKITGDGSPGIPLMEFARTKKVPSTKRLKSGGYTPKKGIPVLIRKDRGKKAAAGVFLARMRSGHTGAFMRSSTRSGNQNIHRGSSLGNRFIVAAYGPSAIKILGADRYDKIIEEYGQEQLAKNLAHEAARILQQAGLQ